MTEGNHSQGHSLQTLQDFQMQRVKVYRLNNEGLWDDKGTGHVSVEYMEVWSLCVLVKTCCNLLRSVPPSSQHRLHVSGITLDTVWFTCVVQLDYGWPRPLPSGFKDCLSKAFAESSRSSLKRQARRRRHFELCSSLRVTSDSPLLCCVSQTLLTILHWLPQLCTSDAELCISLEGLS